MTDAILWLVTADLAGLAVLPFVLAAFPALADRGWATARPVGMLVVGSLVWLFGYLGLLPNVAWAWWLVLGLTSGVVWARALGRRTELAAFVRSRWRAILAAEMLFLAFFVGIALLKAFDPNIAGTEKPMDLMLLNAGMSAASPPPADPWLSGSPVAYYYFGYWMFGGIAQMSGVVAEVAYNLALALVAGMSSAALFSLVYNLVRRDGARLRPAVACGTAGAVLLLVAANLAGLWELAVRIGAGSGGFYEWLAIDGIDGRDAWAGWRPADFWWWWNASRVINTFAPGGAGLDFTIQEFPFFSLLLGDLHPHVMSLPFVIVGATAACGVMVSPDRWGFGWLRGHRSATAMLVLLIGSAGFVNAWDITFLAAVMAAVVWVKSYGQQRRGIYISLLNGLAPLLVVGAAGVAIYSPFYFGTLGSQLQSPPLAPAAYGSRPIQFLTVWALMLLVPIVAIGPIVRRTLWPSWLKARRRPGVTGHPTPASDRWPWLVALAGVAVPYLTWAVTHLIFNELANPGDLITRLSVAGPLALASVALFVTVFLRARRGADDGAQFVLVISLVAVYLLYGAELFFVHDLFANRMNTVFKFYYQAWLLLAIAGGYGLFVWRRTHVALSGRRLVASRTLAVLAAVLLGVALYYPVAASASKVDTDGAARPTLDGLAFVRDQKPAEWAAIEWLRDERSESDVLVEAVGGSYTEFSRLAGASGMPTILGWPGHERQWRGTEAEHEDIDRREADVRNIYVTTSATFAETLLAKYGATYVAVGPRERRQYPDLKEQKFDTLGSRVFESDDLSIYRLHDRAVTE